MLIVDLLIVGLLCGNVGMYIALQKKISENREMKLSLVEVDNMIKKEVANVLYGITSGKPKKVVE